MSAATFFDDTKGAGSCINITFDSKGVAPKYALGYWSIRGLGAPLTMMMCAAKVPFSLFLYDITEDDKAETRGWKSDYFQAKGDYIKKYDAPLWNLPFCVDRENEQVICQTNAIFASLGRACGMYGCDENTTSQCEQLLCEIYDLRDVMVKYCYGAATAAPKDTLTNAKRHFVKLEAWLEGEAKRTNSGDKRSNPGDSPETNVVHLVDGKFSAPDFHLYEMLDQFEEFAKYYKLGNFLDDFGRLKAFKEGFSSLEENNFYLESWLHTEMPINNCMAQFGSLPGPGVYKYSESGPSATWRGKGVISMSPSSTS